MEEYGSLFARLEALKAEMEQAEARGVEQEELLRLRRRLLTLELEITDLRLRELDDARSPREAQREPSKAPAAPPMAEAPVPVRVAPPAASRPAPAPVPPARPVPAPGPRGTGSRYVYQPSPSQARQMERFPKTPNGSPSMYTPAEPAAGPSSVHVPPSQAARRPLELSESGVGKYLLSLLASLLVLLACCALILMGWSYMSAPVKALVIALGGGAFTGAGLLLSKRVPKSFADSLAACGLGIFYADVVALYQAWHLVPLGAVLALILAWDGACVLLGKRSGTKLFFYVLSLGNFITAALAAQLIANSPLSAVSLLFVAGTQAGTILACRRLYGTCDPVLTFTAGAAALYLDLVHFAFVYRFFRGYETQPGGWVILCLALCAALTWAVLAASGWTLGIKDRAGRAVGYLCMNILLLLCLFPVGDALGYYGAAAYGLAALWHHLTIGLLAGGALLCLAAPRTRRAAYCLCAPVLLFCLESLGRYYGLEVLGAGIVALAALAVDWKRSDKVTQGVCAGTCGMSMLLLWTISRQAPYPAAGVPLLAAAVLLLIRWRRRESRRQSWGLLISSWAGALVLAQGGLMARRESLYLALLYLALLGGYLAALSLLLKTAYGRDPVLGIHERVQGYLCQVLYLSFSQGLLWALPAARAVAAALLVLQGVWLVYSAYFRWETGRQFGWGLAAAACLTLGVLQGGRLTPAGDVPILLSLLCIALAAGYIVLGFARGAKPLRIFGLGLSIAGVLKMVTLDVVGSPSIVRVAALMAGGVLCFVISFIYNRVEQKQARQNREPEQDPDSI